MARLAIVLVNYKRAQDTIECIASLAQSTYYDFDVIVVDNASNDGSVERLRKESSISVMIANENNLGFAGGNNVGIQIALKHGCEFVLLLNNDTVVQPTALEFLMQTMEQYPGTGVVGGKIYYFDQPNVLWFAGGCFNFNSGFGYHIGIGEEDQGRYDAFSECDYISGCMLMFRRNVVEKIGLLDEHYFAYLEDVDFCFRARQAGFSVFYQPKSVIHHKISQTSAWDSKVYIYFNLRNKILFLGKNSSPGKWLPHLPRLVYFYIRQFVRLIFKYHDLGKVRAGWFGLTDGLRNFTGEYGKGRLFEL